MATIYDIAKKTGFSPPTVSKALNGAGTLSDKTRDLINNTAKEMGYVPNLTAWTLSTRRSRLIGIINKDIYLTNAFIPPIFNNILGGFKEVMETEGYDLLMLSNSRELHPGGNYRNIDAFLIFTAPAARECHILRETRRPCISTNDIIPGISTVITGNYEGAVEAVQYLVDLGHRHIAYIAGPETEVSTASAERFQGYRVCLEKNSIPYEEGLTEKAELWSAQGGYEAAKRLLCRTPRHKRSFSALFACSDNLAYGAIRALREADFRLPEDISIIGFDGDLLCEYTSPTLTTMRQNSLLIGKTAAELLLEKLAGGECPDFTRIKAELVVRESCCAPQF
ncbi:LacI family transcriptional regulator [Spirochaetia bacterium]|nr:LacI family transcriptional regulator [Spirochaetia bacterium]